MAWSDLIVNGYLLFMIGVVLLSFAWLMRKHRRAGCSWATSLNKAFMSAMLLGAIWPVTLLTLAVTCWFDGMDQLTEA